MFSAIMRCFVGVLSCLLILGGCASRSGPRTPVTTYEDSPATSLVFDPVNPGDGVAINLWRDGRGPAAFAGYEGLTTTYIDVRTYDRQTNDGSDFYLRRTWMERVGVSYR